MTIGQNIKEARKRAGLTQLELAQKLGISYVGISQWERDMRNPKYDTLKKIAFALNIPVESLIGEDSDNWGDTVGERLTNMLAYRKCTTADVAARTGIDESRLEHALVEAVELSLEELVKIAECLGTDLPSIRGEKRPPFMRETLREAVALRMEAQHEWDRKYGAAQRDREGIKTKLDEINPEGIELISKFVSWVFSSPEFIRNPEEETFPSTPKED